MMSIGSRHFKILPETIELPYVVIIIIRVKGSLLFD